MSMRWRVFFQDADKLNHRTRAKALETGLEKVATEYPEDSEATILYALVLSANFDPADKQYGNQLRAARLLEPIFAKQPEHPGAAHYLIHSYDYPPLATQGLPAAQRYSKIAPAASHAQHMPSHIFTRVGAWNDSVAANTVSAKADTASGPNTLHAYDYMTYAHLQMGQDRAAQAVRDSAIAIAKRPDNFAAAYAYAAIPARLALERGDWADAAELPLTPAADAYPWAKYPQAEASNAYARALGAAALRDGAATETELARLARLRDAATELKIGYWVEQIGIQIDVVRGFAAFKAGQTDAGIAGLQKAAEREDASEKHAVTPGPLLPARELLASALLERGDAAGALREFEAVLRKEPNRLRAMAGAGVAAERAGDSPEGARLRRPGLAPDRASRCRHSRSEAGAAVGDTMSRGGQSLPALLLAARAMLMLAMGTARCRRKRPAAGAEDRIARRCRAPLQRRRRAVAGAQLPATRSRSSRPRWPWMSSSPKRTTTSRSRCGCRGARTSRRRSRTTTAPSN